MTIRAIRASNIIMNPRLSRALYRSFLRVSENGKYPEVFGLHGAQIYQYQIEENDDHPSMAIPSTPRHVRQRIKKCFREGTVLDDSPLEILRQANQRAALLVPSSDNNSHDDRNNQHGLQHQYRTDVVPIFDYDRLSALPGESIHTMFLEPRYINCLLPHVQSSPTRQFLLRHSPESSTATILTLLSHKEVNFFVEPENPVVGIAVFARAGDTIEIIKQESESVSPDVLKQNNNDDANSNTDVDNISVRNFAAWNTSTVPLSKATYWKYKKDHEACDNGSSNNNNRNKNDRQYILNMMEQSLRHSSGKDLAETLATHPAEFGLPPLDVGSFSKWALRLVLANDDVEGRQYWLHSCQSTTKRMEFVIKAVEDILEAQQDDLDNYIEMDDIQETDGSKEIRAEIVDEEEDDDDEYAAAVSYG